MVDMPKGSQAPRRRPSLRGVLMQDIAYGQERVRAWPRSRGPAKTKAEKAAQDKFALIQRMAAYLAPGVLAYIHKAVGNSPLLPRDVVTMMLYNRWMAFDLEDGRTLWPMVAYNDVSEALDVLTKEVGDYLVRTAGGWRGASTLPIQSPHLKQGYVCLKANVPGFTGFFSRVPFDKVSADPQGWWTGAPKFEWKPDVPGFYFFELSVRKLTQQMNVVWVQSSDLTTRLLQGIDESDIRQAVVTGMLWLDGKTAVTSGGFGNGAGTFEGLLPTDCFFKITGPF